MPSQLKISLGQHSERGRKETNQDFHGACIPGEPQRTEKGIAVALADGISSSTVSQSASQATIRAFLEDYYGTSPAWSVKKSARQVLLAVNSWLHAQTLQSQFRYDRDRGYVCTLAALVLKSNTAHVLSVGDTRVYRLRPLADERGRFGEIEQLTADHRTWIAPGQSYLSRAMGMGPDLEIDYLSVMLEPGDVFCLATDGVYDFLAPGAVARVVAQHANDLDAAASALVAEALGRGSDDNLSVQLVRVDELPARGADEAQSALRQLPFPPLLASRDTLDGYRILRELHASARSHVYLASDADGTQVVIKTLARELQDDPAAVDRFLLEDWIARRMNSAHVIKAGGETRARSAIYTVTEHVDGQTLAQWMIDNPKPDLETVRGIIEQIAGGLLAFHRLEMLHQDLRPANVMIDGAGIVKIIDFGSTRVAGLEESGAAVGQDGMLGTVQYTAPEYLLGEPASERSDQFSLGVIAYQMLSGKLPYGAAAARARTRAAQRRLVYRSVVADDREIPRWMDDVLRRATHVDPSKRYEELSEFVHELRHPNADYLRRTRAPLIERDPVAFWKGLSAVLALLALTLLAMLLSRGAS